VKRFLKIPATLILLVSIFAGALTPHVAGAAEQEIIHRAVIDSSLHRQIDEKLQMLQKTGADEDRSLMSPQMVDEQNISPPDTQNIFIFSAARPGPDEIKELESLGLVVYEDSWVPPVGSHPAGFLSADMPVDKLYQVADIPFIVRMSTAERYMMPVNDLGVQTMNVDGIRGLGSGYDGTGIRITVLDSGLDITHEDIPVPLVAKDYHDWPVIGDNVANTVSGHGTHVAGSVLGRGTLSGGVYRGVAPGADLIFLKVGDNSTDAAKTVAVVNAINDAVHLYNADIITYSYGGWDDYHDGTSATAQAIDYAVSQGVVVFVSAGNEANNARHYSGTVPAYGSTDYIQVNVTGAGYNDTGLDFNLVWNEGMGQNVNLTLEYYAYFEPEYHLLSDYCIYYPQSESARGTESQISYLNSWMPSGDSIWYLKVRNDSAVPQNFHIYEDAGFAGRVKFANHDPNYTITSPADADGAIAVGAHTTRDIWWNYKNEPYYYADGTLDEIATFSSRGPLVHSSAPLTNRLIIEWPH
jgi:subtilisin family serine protease